MTCAVFLGQMDDKVLFNHCGDSTLFLYRISDEALKKFDSLKRMWVVCPTCQKTFVVKSSAWWNMELDAKAYTANRLLMYLNDDKSKMPQFIRDIPNMTLNYLRQHLQTVEAQLSELDQKKKALQDSIKGLGNQVN